MDDDDDDEDDEMTELRLRRKRWLMPECIRVAYSSVRRR